MQCEQPDLELSAGEPRGRQRVDSLSERRPCDREGVDRVGLPALADPAAGVGHQPWGEAHDRLAAIDQEPLQRPGHVPDVLDHPHPLEIELARPLQQVTESLTPGSFE